MHVTLPSASAGACILRCNAQPYALAKAVLGGFVAPGETIELDAAKDGDVLVRNS